MSPRQAAGRALRAAAVIGAVSAFGAACATADQIVTVTPGEIDPPLPAGARWLTAEEAARTVPVQAEDCDATAGLRPDPAGIDRDAAEVRAVLERGRLVVGLDPGSNLFSFRDPLTGELVGFDVDLAREIARDLLGDPDRVDFRFLSSAEREQALREGTVDLVVKTMTITCERAREVDFSTVYLRAHQRLLVPQGSPITDLADLAGRRVCIVAGTTSIARIAQRAPETEILSVPSWGDCLVALQQDRVDAVSTDDTILAGMVAQDPNLIIVGPPIAEEPYGVGLPPGSDALTRAVNATVERIRTDGTWTAMYQRWLPMLGPAPAPPEPSYVD